MGPKLRVIALYVDRSSRQWVIRDEEGNLWTLPQSSTGENEWKPFSPSEETELEPVPSHYKYLLRLPA
jgi:hypothetical protein